MNSDVRLKQTKTLQSSLSITGVCFCSDSAIQRPANDGAQGLWAGLQKGEDESKRSVEAELMRMLCLQTEKNPAAFKAPEDDER